jgi:hypothetical protein
MMQKIPQPELKNMLVEATHALAHLDAGRLEEMALSCAALVRDVNQFRCETKIESEAGSGEDIQEIAIFARVLEATRANLNVMRRLGEMRAAQLEYDPVQTVCKAFAGGEHGDH